MSNFKTDCEFRNIVQNLTSDTNLKNLEQLRFYKYSQEFRKNPKNGKVVVVYICGHPDCGKEFMRTWNLLDHVRMHAGIKPYKCTECDKSFTQVGNMRKHMQQHYSSSISQQNGFESNSKLDATTGGINFMVGLLFVAKTNFLLLKLLHV